MQVIRSPFSARPSASFCPRTAGHYRQAGLDMFRGLAVILLAWFGIKSALSASQGHGGFHFGKFADLILLISFGLGMLTYYSTPIPVSVTASATLSQRGSQYLRPNRVRHHATDRYHGPLQPSSNSERSGNFNILEDLVYLILALLLAAMEAVSFGRESHMATLPPPYAC